MSFSLLSPATTQHVRLRKKRSAITYLLLVALFTTGAVAYFTLLYPRSTFEIEKVHIVQVVQNEQNEPALPSFNGPFTCNPAQIPSWKIPNRTFSLKRPPTDATFDTAQPLPYDILLWPSPTYGNYHRVIFDVNDACPYPVSLYPFFSHLNNRFQPNESWPLGWAPCMLQRGIVPSSGTCKDSAGEVITYNYHGNFTKFEEASVIFVDYPFYFYQGRDSPPFYNEEMFPPRRSHQSWWLQFVEESLGYYPWFGMHAMLARFDLTVGQPRSLFDLPAPTFPVPPYKSISEENPTPKRKRTDAPIAMMISNCEARNKRKQYLEELMTHVPIHSYGTCLHNAEIDPDILMELGLAADTPLNFELKKRIFNQYKFVIAFENSNCEDYVTEKIYHAYEAKAIPIYMGAHNIDQFVPHLDSYLNVANFSSPAELASHILRVAGDYRLEQSYHTWRQPKSELRTMPPDRENSLLRQMYQIQEENVFCRMLSRAVVA